MRIRDPGAARIRATAPCRAEDAHTAVCEYLPGDLPVIAHLGDRDDHGTIGGGSVDGGPGDDTLSASGSAGLRGAPGSDALTGSPSDDHFVDADGATPGADRYEGGGGMDVVDYHHRRSGIVIDLPAGTAAEDCLTAIEGAKGGSGDDRLLGTDASGGFNGGPGDDVIRAGGGDDQIRPGTGADTVDAGAGDDDITVPDGKLRGTGDRIQCGAGRDFVDSAGESDRLLAGCERFAFNSSLMIENTPHYFPRGSGALVLRIDGCCDAANTSASLTAGGRRIGRAVRTRDDVILLRLTATGWRRLRRAGRLVAQVIIRSTATSYERRGTRLELRAPAGG